jgi:hypothetical protein
MLYTSRRDHNKSSHKDLCIVRLPGDKNEFVVAKDAEDRFGDKFHCPLCDSIAYSSYISMQKHFDRMHKKASLDMMPEIHVVSSSQGGSYPPTDEEEKLEQSEVLQKIGCHYNTAYRLIVCGECRHALDPRSIAVHVKKHDLAITNEEYRSILAKHSPLGPKAFRKIQPDLHDAIMGIEYRANGKWCGWEGCKGARSTTESMRGHCDQSHPGESAHHLATVGPVQVVFGPPSRCTRLKPAIDPDAVGLRASHYLKNFPEQHLEGIDPDSDKVLAPMLRGLKWNEYYDGISKGPHPITRQSYHKLSHTYDPSESDKLLKVAFREYGDHLKPLIDRAHSLPLRWINTKE